jgi:hypothetical protein
MDEPYADTLATVAAGRAAAVAELRQLADRLEALPVDAAVEVLIRLEHALVESYGRTRPWRSNAPRGLHLNESLAHARRSRERAPGRGILVGIRSQILGSEDSGQALGHQVWWYGTPLPRYKATRRDRHEQRHDDDHQLPRRRTTAP